MTSFQQSALVLIAVWFALIVFKYQRSTIVLISGLIVIGLFTIFSVFTGHVTWEDIGLTKNFSWLPTLGYAAGGVVVLLAYSPIADRVASTWVEKPPTLDSFRAMQQSKINLILGIIIAWALGGFLEELIARGIVLRSVETFLGSWIAAPLATIFAILLAAIGAGLLHSYQGPRAVVIITQLSILFGVLFVLSRYNLWTVILCHGLYDTIAFIRFAIKKSPYAV